MTNANLSRLGKGLDFETLTNEIRDSVSLSELPAVRCAIQVVIERILREYISDPVLLAACWDSFEGSRRLKPLLALLGFTIQNRPVTLVGLFLAAIAELCTSILVGIDDVVDMDEIHGRRGTKSLYGLYGSGGAVVIVSLLTEIVVASLARFTPQALPVYLNYFERCLTMQFDNACTEGTAAFNTQSYLQDILRTNGFFYALSFKLVSACTEDDMGELESLVELGQLIGTLEQLYDDLEDVGKDSQRGYQTYPVILLQQRMATQDESGQPSHSLPELAKMKASVEGMMMKVLGRAKCILQDLANATAPDSALRMSSIRLLGQVLEHTRSKSDEQTDSAVPRYYKRREVTR